MTAKTFHKWAEENELNETPAHPPAENAENAEFPPIPWDQLSANSANSAGSYVQAAIFPPDSVLADWFTFARERTEGADCYVVGTILPVVAADPN